MRFELFVTFLVSATVVSSQASESTHTIPRPSGIPVTESFPSIVSPSQSFSLPTIGLPRPSSSGFTTVTTDRQSGQGPISIQTQTSSRSGTFTNSTIESTPSATASGPTNSTLSGVSTTSTSSTTSSTPGAASGRVAVNQGLGWLLGAVGALGLLVA